MAAGIQYSTFVSVINLSPYKKVYDTTVFTILFNHLYDVDIITHHFYPVTLGITLVSTWMDIQHSSWLFNIRRISTIVR